MADTCSDVYAALARLEAKIDAIPKLDEQSIIQKAIKGAEGLLTPQIVAVGGVAATATYKAGVAQQGANLAKELADDALKLGGQALSKIGVVAGGLADLVGRFSGLLGIVLNLLTTIAIVYVLGSRIDSLEKDIGVLRQIIEADAALTKKAIEASNQAIEKANFAISQANLAISQANLAINQASGANSKANDALDKSKAAIFKADKATELANGANSTATKAKQTADDANYKVDRVAAEIPKINAKFDAIDRKFADFEAGVRAVHADLVKRLGIVFEALINAINAHSSELHGRIDILSDKINDRYEGFDNVLSSIAVLTGLIRNLGGRTSRIEGEFPSIQNTAIQANNKSANAVSTANRAINEIEGLRSPIGAANRKAEQAQSTANQVSAQVPPLRLLSEKAYGDALKAYNKVNTDVPPVASGIEQVRRAGQSIEQQFKNSANAVQEQFKGINSTIQSRLAQPAQTITNQQQIINQQFQILIPAINNRITALERVAVNPQDSATLKRIETQIANFPKTIGAPTTEQIKQALTPGLLAVPLAVGAIVLPRLLSPAQVTTAAQTAVCQEAQPGRCLGTPLNNLQNGQNRQNNLLQGLGAGLQAGQGALLTAMNNTLNGVSRGVNAVNATALTINAKMGAQMAGGLAGGVGRLGTFLGIDRIFNLLTFLATLHNASMLTSSFKVTLLETLSSVGNATGLLESPEKDSVDLNKTFDKGIEAFIVKVVGVETYAQMTLSWRKYNPIFRAGANVLSNVGNMFSSIGNGIEVIGERTGKIGNALRAASVVRENAYNFMSENMNVHTSKFMTFQTKIGGATEVLEAINEVAENVIEGQQSYTEAVNATNAFKKTLAEADKDSEKKDTDNTAIKAEAEKIKANLVKDPTGEDETGLLSFLTDL